MKKKFFYKKGIGLIEVLIATFIFTIILGGLIVASNIYLSGARDNLYSTKAAYLAEEGIEAVKIIRDADWTNISSLLNGTDYYLYFDSGLSIWKATTTPSFIDLQYERKINLNAVNRDFEGRIVQSGGVQDDRTKKLTVSISWQGKKGMITKSITTYITDFISD